MEISAKVVAHSKSSVNGKEVITFELVYPRFIHGELMTHRMFSRNAASSRAIPIQKMIDQVHTEPATPVHWGKSQAGMQAKEELSGAGLEAVKREWHTASGSAIYHAKILKDVGAHKQVVNRILEPFQWMKTIVTATEYENFFWLRNHEDAQPEIKRLAEEMYAVLQTSMPATLEPGDWHTPYYAGGWWDKNCESSLEDALAISSSCCAQVSYRLLDDSLEKAKMIYKRLVESEPVHASPFEHQATPIQERKEMVVHEYPDQYVHHGKNLNTDNPTTWEGGITHSDRNGNLWSGNFKGWIQHRQLIPNNVKQG